MINIFLDDIRVPSMSHNSNRGLGDHFSPIGEWVVVRDFFEFKSIVDERFDDINIVSFDHDLACYDDNGQELTGKNAADYLIEYCLSNNRKFPNWYVHSDNTSGKSNIINMIISYLRVVEGLDTSKFRYYHNGLINNKLYE